MPEEGSLIQFCCVAADHQDAKGSSSDTLTIHEGKWAFCPYDIRANGHEWEATGGVSVAEVRRLVDRGRSAHRSATP
ncbi:MAG TPA: hypothetical protein VEU77_10460 [Candidatus Acidoferrales bacterium]|nr:hypothetical protein [Candidatus Acidoferrales bacterium]